MYSDKLDFSGPVHLGLEMGHEHKFSAPAPYVTEPMHIPLDVAEETPDTGLDDAENSSTGITPVDTPSGLATETLISLRTGRSVIRLPHSDTRDVTVSGP